MFLVPRDDPEDLGWVFHLEIHKRSHEDTVLQFILGPENLAGNHLSHEKKPSYFPLYWVVNRDPYNGLL